MSEENKKPLIDVTQMSVYEIARLINNNPEIIERLAIAKAEQDRREAERVKRKAEEKQRQYNELIAPVVGAVIQGIEELAESEYEYAGQSVIHTSVGDIFFDGTIDRIELKTEAKKA